MKANPYKNGDKVCLVGKIKGKSGDHWGTLQNLDGSTGEVKLDDLSTGYPTNGVIIKVGIKQ